MECSGDVEEFIVIIMCSKIFLIPGCGFISADGLGVQVGRLSVWMQTGRSVRSCVS
jgi:hypothetical protein